MNAKPSTGRRLLLKQRAGWFAAGRSFRQALELLSDGAFKLFVYLCLEADRSTGKLQATHRQLAQALDCSKRAIGTYLKELQQRGVCTIVLGQNQYGSSCFQITDDYWPYHREQVSMVTEAGDGDQYVSAIREAFLGIGSSAGQFGPSDVRTAKALQRRGVPLVTVLDAIQLGSCRKYISWLNGGLPEAIGGLAYFEQLIAELQERPLEDDYRQYLRVKNQQLADGWRRKAAVQQHRQKGGYLDMASGQIVQ